jgi:hypothetical protein
MLISKAAAASEENSLLMVGNSYIDYYNMESMVEKMLKEGGLKNVDTKIFEHAAARFTEFQDAPELKSMIIDRPWKWILLQEQSEIPALLNETDDFEKSEKSLVVLNDWIKVSGASTVLLLTWGRLTFDVFNPSLFTNFTWMQDRVKVGYEKYANLISTRNRSAKIAPAGLAYKMIHEDLKGRGQDPTEPGNDFSNLYENNDEAHKGYPSVAGSYLTACVIYGTLTKRDVSLLKWTPEAFDKEYAKRLRLWATKTLKEYEFKPERPVPAPYVPHDAPSYTQPKEGRPILFKFFILSIFGAFVTFVALPKWKLYRLRGYSSYSRSTERLPDYEMPYIHVGQDDELL